jgi:hypothetical protein
MMEAEMVSETLRFYPQLTRLVTQNDLIDTAALLVCIRTKKEAQRGYLK